MQKLTSEDSSILEKKGLKILHINIRSLLPKIEEVRIYMQSMRPDFLCVSETWLKSDADDFEVKIAGYNFIRKDRNITKKNRGGGILIYFKETCTNITNISTPDSSSDIISILYKQPNSKPLNIITGYRPEHDKQFEENLEKVLKKNNYEKVLIGDFNYEVGKRNIDWKNLMMKYDLTQLIKSCTRKTQSSNSILDHIYTSNLKNTSCSGVFNWQPADHHCV